MLAPVDAKATFEAGGETFTLAMNMRTIALAETAWPGSVTGFMANENTLTGTATLLWAYAQPAHPELTKEQALAMVFADHQPVVDALAEVFTVAVERTARPAGADQDPPKAA